MLMLLPGFLGSLFSAVFFVKCRGLAQKNSQKSGKQLSKPHNECAYLFFCLLAQTPQGGFVFP